MNDGSEESLDKAIFDDHWESLPPAKSFDIRNYEDHPLRSTILRILYDGLSNQVPSEIKRKRHVLNASEILEELNKRIEAGRIVDSKKGKETTLIKPVSITNLYFHLNKLIDLGLIKVIAELLEGSHKRNKTKYYGRVARHLFISDEEESLQKYRRLFDAFQRVVMAMGVPLPEDYEKLPVKYQRIKNTRYKAIENWFIKNEKIIYEISEQNRDLSEVYEFLKLMDSHFSDAYRDLSSRFTELIQRELG
ncbi:MAG: hypothetical protein ACFFFG_07445 [Candidatus Thorarchaeota archaeon]